MSSAHFKISTHVFPGQHIRQYPAATRHKEEDVQYLEVKQYTPASNLQPQDGDVTIIGTCATSFPKEMYERLWDALLEHSTQQGIRIRSIWCVDKTDHGGSIALNERTQGDDPSYIDHARDVLQMVNVFRDQMTLPIVGVGHSMGATSLLEVARLHPRLFSSLVLTDPIIGAESYNAGVYLVYSAALRPDVWNSWEEAETFFRTAKHMKSWDPRVMDLWLKYGLRDTPTPSYPKRGKVTLRMSSAMESFNYARPYFNSPSEDEESISERSRIKYPDIGDVIARDQSFYRPETMQIWEDLHRIQCSVLYLFPESGPLSTAKSMEEKVERTGSGALGSGGTKYGRTAMTVLKKAGHLAPFEKPEDCARETTLWLAKDLEGWRARRAFERKNRDDKSIDGLALSEEWKTRAKGWMNDYKAEMRRKPKL